jgi:hypothetical protein
MPHELQAAKSGRAKCRACKQPIEKGTLRLGEEVPNAFGDGEAKHWYHMRCGALRRPEAFIAAVGDVSDEVSPLLDDGEKAELLVLAEPGTVYYRLARFVKAHAAPSGRARCQGCRELIERGALRFVLERIEDGMVSGGGFVHIACAHAYAGAVDGVLERVQNLSELSEEEWAQVKAALEEQAKLERVVPEKPPS